MCPWPQVCVLLERRLDQEEVVADITRSCDGVKKEVESLKQKLKRIEQARHATESDIEDFQREKQARCCNSVYHPCHSSWTSVHRKLLASLGESTPGRIMKRTGRTLPRAKARARQRTPHARMQAALNEIESVVLLRAHQIECLVDGRLPTDLSGALVFSNAELARLRARIDVRPLVAPLCTCCSLCTRCSQRRLCTIGCSSAKVGAHHILIVG
jgi:hypothetical protein